ncbi:MAG: hypothetical protein ABSH19_07980, partial [Opitutales bacterium]
MEALLYLVAAFYLAGLPILVFVALAKSSGSRREVEYLEGQLKELWEQVQELKKKQPEAATETPAAFARRETVYAPFKAAAPASPAPAVEPKAPVVSAPSTPEPTMAAKIMPPEPKPEVPPPLVREPTMPLKVPEPEPGSKIRPSFPAPAYTTQPPKPAEQPAAAYVPEKEWVEASNTSAAEPREKDPHLEIQLGAWWATRLGISFLVVAVVFFGVYVSVHATPWVRLLEVLAIAGGLAGLGRWIERTMPIYGRVVFAGGLALGYFAAYAAYAVPAVKVVSSLGLGLALQFAAVLGLTAIAMARNRQGLALMAVFTGTLSCFFALSNGELEVTLGAALGLAVVGAGLRTTKAWAWPLTLGYAGAQACYVAAVLTATGHPLEILAVADRLHATSRETWPGFTLVFPTAFFAVMTGADLLAQMRGRKGAAQAREMAIRVAAVAYGLGAWWGGAAMGGDWAKWNMLTAAGACLAVGMIYRQRKDLPSLYEMLFAAAGAWVAVYAILEYAGWVRWS